MTLKLRGIGICRIRIRVSGFKIIQSVISRVVRTLPKDSVAGAVLHFPGLVPADKTKNLFTGFIIVCYYHLCLMRTSFSYSSENNSSTGFLERVYFARCLNYELQGVFLDCLSSHSINFRQNNAICRHNFSFFI